MVSWKCKRVNLSTHYHLQHHHYHFSCCKVSCINYAWLESNSFWQVINFNRQINVGVSFKNKTKSQHFQRLLIYICWLYYSTKHITLHSQLRSYWDSGLLKIIENKTKQKTSWFVYWGHMSAIVFLLLNLISLFVYCVPRGKCTLYSMCTDITKHYKYKFSYCSNAVQCICVELNMYIPGASAH